MDFKQKERMTQKNKEMSDYQLKRNSTFDFGNGGYGDFAQNENIVKNKKVSNPKGEEVFEKVIDQFELEADSEEMDERDILEQLNMEVAGNLEMADTMENTKSFFAKDRREKERAVADNYVDEEISVNVEKEAWDYFEVIEEEDVEKIKEEMEKERREQAAKEKAESDKVIHKAIVNSVTMAELETFDYTQLLKWAKASANIDGVKGDFGGLLELMDMVQFYRNMAINSKNEERRQAASHNVTVYIEMLKTSSSNYVSSHSPWFKSGKMRKRLAGLLNEGNPSMLDKIEKEANEYSKYPELKDMRKINPCVNTDTVELTRRYKQIDAASGYYIGTISSEEIKKTFGDSNYDRLIGGVLRPIKLDKSGNILPEYRENDNWNKEYIAAIRKSDYEVIGNKINDLINEYTAFKITDDLKSYDYIFKHFEEIVRFNNISLRLYSNIIKSVPADKIGISKERLEAVGDMNESAASICSMISTYGRINAGTFDMDNGSIYNIFSPEDSMAVKAERTNDYIKSQKGIIKNAFIPMFGENKNKFEEARKRCMNS